MNVAVLGILCVSLLLVAGALLLWQGATARGRRSVASAFVERQLVRDAGAVAAAPADTIMQSRQSGHGKGLAGIWNNLLLRAGVVPSAAFFAFLFCLLVLLPLVLWLLSGPLGAMVVFVLAAASLNFYLWFKASRRLGSMVRQLPGFIDALVRLITIGNSLGSAFHTAVPAVERPLLEVLDRVDQLSRAGMELDQAMFHGARLYKLRELELVGAIVGVALRFGGRSDMVLERMAGFMRDLQQAREELHALSAEVRLSAWILGLLPVLVAGFIIIFNNALFMGMWSDTTGRYLLIGALTLQIAGSYWLYRMAKSV